VLSPRRGRGPTLPTRSEPSIRRVTIEAFRGFRDRQEFDINASAVIVSGPNGTGKTSFFDALQWALVGRIERLESVRARSTVEHIVNQYRLDSRASVEVEMTIGGNEFRIRRVGDHRRTSLEFGDASGRVMFGDEAEHELQAILAPNPGITLEMALSTSGLMQQDVMRSVLQAKPADRYRHISMVLGLSELEDFEAQAKDAAKKAADAADLARTQRDAASAALSEARARLQRSEEQQLLRIPVEAVLAGVTELLEQAHPLVHVDRTDALRSEAGVARLASEIGRLAEAVQIVVDEHEALALQVASIEPEPAPETVAAATAAVTAAKASLDANAEATRSAREALGVAQRASEEMARLAAAAIPLLSSVCPVCGQGIDPREVEQELRSHLGASETLLALQDVLDAALQHERDESARHRAAVESERAMIATQSTWLAVKDRQAGLDRSFTALAAEGQPARIDAPDVESLVAAASSLTDYLATARRRLLEAADVFAHSSSTGAVERSAAEVRSFEETLGTRTSRLEDLSQRATLAKNLADASVDARVEVTEQRFRAIQPLVADIFSRLDPHPAFKTIEFELDTYYRRGTTTPLVRDLVENVRADPLVIFSTSQANIAALSYFLAMGWTAGERSMPFVLLDDPLQSMDDVNVLGFSDLCRHLRANRQLLISTHERRLSGLLERKLAPRGEFAQTVVLEFVGWDRSGPTVQRRVVEPQVLEPPIRLVRAAS
jgi:DNA repair exonuclease SbcCD ATPase subunit